MQRDAESMMLKASAGRSSSEVLLDVCLEGLLAGAHLLMHHFLVLDEVELRHRLHSPVFHDRLQTWNRAFSARIVSVVHRAQEKEREREREKREREGGGETEKQREREREIETETERRKDGERETDTERDR